MIEASIRIGDEGTKRQWVLVVPDHCINSDALFGCDVLAQSPMTWDDREGILIWGGTTYPVIRVAKRYGQLEGVKTIGDRVDHPMATLRTKSTVRIPLYQSVLYPLEVSETSGTESILRKKIHRSLCAG